MPPWAYRVRTLHGLAHDIVRERPDLVGLADPVSRSSTSVKPHGCSEASAGLAAHATCDLQDHYLSPHERMKSSATG